MPSRQTWSDQIDDALAAADADPDEALVLVGALWGYWLLSGQLARGRRSAERVLAVAGAAREALSGLSASRRTGVPSRIAMLPVDRFTALAA